PPARGAAPALEHCGGPAARAAAGGEPREQAVPQGAEAGGARGDRAGGRRGPHRVGVRGHPAVRGVSRPSAARSPGRAVPAPRDRGGDRAHALAPAGGGRCRRAGRAGGGVVPGAGPRAPTGRSEEHTSELQSRFELVCRLLLEKKKKMCCIAQCCPIETDTAIWFSPITIQLSQQSSVSTSPVPCWGV